MAIDSANTIAAVLAANGIQRHALLTVVGRQAGVVTLSVWTLASQSLQLSVAAAVLDELARRGELRCYCDDDVIEGAPLIVSCPHFAAQYYRLP